MQYAKEEKHLTHKIDQYTFGSGRHATLTQTVTLAWLYIHTLSEQQHPESLTGIPKIPPSNAHSNNQASLLLAVSFSFLY